MTASGFLEPGFRIFSILKSVSDYWKDNYVREILSQKLRLQAVE